MTNAINDLELFEEIPDKLEGLTPGALPEVDAFEEFIRNGKTEKTDRQEDL